MCANRPGINSYLFLDQRGTACCFHVAQWMSLSLFINVKTDSFAIDACQVVNMSALCRPQPTRHHRSLASLLLLSHHSLGAMAGNCVHIHSESFFVCECTQPWVMDVTLGV